MNKRIALVLASLMLALGVFARKDVWVIDPGHGGHDTGCKTRTNREKDLTLAIAKEVGRLVAKEISGVRVVYTRETDVYPTLPERCHIANSKGAALFLSIHVNDAANTFAHGTESYFATNAPISGSQAGKSELLALLLQRAYLNHGRGISRGVKQKELYVCEYTNMPSVLTEVGFLSNLEEERFMASKEGQKALARAIVDALKQWREMTRSGTVSRRELRNLRFMYADPKEQAAKQIPTNAPKKSTNAPTKAANAKETTNADTKGTTSEAQQQETKPEAAPQTSEAPFFSIQIFSVAQPLKPTDKRLKGLKDVRFVDAEGRYKALHGRAASYAEARTLLAEVRKTFPDAFIVAFDGERQISTTEAVQMLKAQGK